MRTFKLNERFILFGIIAAVLFAVTPNASMPAGGPEPGAGCGLEGLKYVAPPYIGPVTITFNDDDNSLTFLGHVEQVGKSECFGIISAEHAPNPLMKEQFQNLKPNDLRQTCLVAEDNLDITIDCVDKYYYYEVVGVGKLKYDATGNSFSAQLVIMALE